MFYASRGRATTRLSLGLAGDVVPAYRPDYLLALAALVSGFHEEMVRLRGDALPFAQQDPDGAKTVVVCALAQEGHWLRPEYVTLDGVVDVLVRLPEPRLVVLSPRFPRHRPVSVPGGNRF
jgi:hypothetical protein